MVHVQNRTLVVDAEYDGTRLDAFLAALVPDLSRSSLQRLIKEAKRYDAACYINDEQPCAWGYARLVWGLAALPEAARTRLSQLFEALELGPLAGRYPSQLSGGEARRVALARALAPRPRRLLLDEPLTSLDPALRERALQAILRQVEETEATLLYVTHDADEATLVGGRMVRMDHGRLAAG